MLLLLLTAALQALWFKPPDVWSQLLRHLQDAACSHARLKGSSAAAEELVSAEMLLAQLVALGADLALDEEPASSELSD
jgi:hypothetical protein